MMARSAAPCDPPRHVPWTDTEDYYQARLAEDAAYAKCDKAYSAADKADKRAAKVKDEARRVQPEADAVVSIALRHAEHRGLGCT